MDDTNQSPATTADLAALEQRMDGKLDGLEHRMDSKLDQLEQRMDDKFTTMKTELLDELKRHFDLTVETIRHDLQGANRDELSMLSDTTRDHEGRLQTLEKVAGIAA